MANVSLNFINSIDLYLDTKIKQTGKKLRYKVISPLKNSQGWKIKKVFFLKYKRHKDQYETKLLQSFKEHLKENPDDAVKIRELYDSWSVSPNSNSKKKAEILKATKLITLFKPKTKNNEPKSIKPLVLIYPCTENFEHPEISRAREYFHNSPHFRDVVFNNLPRSPQEDKNVTEGKNQFFEVEKQLKSQFLNNFGNHFCHSLKLNKKQNENIEKFLKNCFYGLLDTVWEDLKKAGNYPPQAILANIIDKINNEQKIFSSPQIALIKARCGRIFTTDQALIQLYEEWVKEASIQKPKNVTLIDLNKTPTKGCLKKTPPANQIIDDAQILENSIAKADQKRDYQIER